MYKQNTLNKKINGFLERFNLTSEEIDLYIQLLSQGPKTTVEISNSTTLSRTTVYRIIESLQIKGLMKEQISENGRKFEASSPDTLKMKLIEKELSLKSLEDSLPEIYEMLSAITKENISKSTIKYYRGIEGLKQVTWNSTKAKDEFRIYEINKMISFLDEDFHTEVIDEFVKNKIVDFQLTNFKEYNEYTENEEFVKKYWQLRYIDKNEINIDFETLIYNDVYTIYEYKNDDVFCVEIYSEKLAEMQKDIFNFVWKFAQPMKIIDLKGKAVLDD
jgi:sugar-specific transcriptional regulator TrmB